MTPTIVETPKVVSSESVGTLAIELTDVYFKYGRTAKSPLILNGLSITILQGEIYALLGPSGCGKTTTLKCISKSVVPNSGTVLLPVNQTSKTRIPGTGVGFMPQELALFPDLTIRETLHFFGGINGIPNSVLRKRIKKLTAVFELPPDYRYVGTLSGGQKRRVSLIAALLHDPPILVLDEPTVGIDPILRQTVWNYLLTLTKVENKTVLVTTHYIDEAKDAMTVGLMRDGRVLTESSPANLMNHFKEKSLEVCFYKLCLQGEKNRVDKELTGRRESDCPEFPMKPISSFPDGFESTVNLLASKLNLLRREKHGSTPGNVATLIKKNLMLLKRSFMMLLFQFVLPALTVALFGLCVGGRVFDLPVAIVNEETPPYFSGRFIRLLENQPIIMNNFNTLEEGIASVKSGDSRVAIHIHRDFSHCLIKRLQHGLGVSNDTLECSSVKLHMDTTNQIISLDLQLMLWKTFEDFQRIMLGQLAVSESIAALPIVFSEPPIYGTLDVKFGEYVTPAIILICTHFLATILTAVSLVMEKESGVFERLKVNGVTKTQIFAAQLLTNLLVVIFQGILVLAVQFSFFDTPLHGSIFYVIAIILMQGFCGMVFGFFISSIANNVTSVLIIGLGVFYPNLFLCGLVWPIEGMPHAMRYFARFIPLTLTIESLRSILSRGWGLESLTVWLGLISVTAWSGFFLIVAVLIFKLKK